MKTLTINGKAVTLRKDGKSKGGRMVYRATTGVEGMPGAQAFVVVYMPLPRRRGKNEPAPVTPPQPSPPVTEDLQLATVRTLQAITRRLGELEARVSEAPHELPQPPARGKRLDPRPSA